MELIEFVFERTFVPKPVMLWLTIKKESSLDFLFTAIV